MLGSSSTIRTLDIVGYDAIARTTIVRTSAAGRDGCPWPRWGRGALRQELRREPLPFRDPLDLHRDRVDRVLHALQTRRDVGRNLLHAALSLHPLRERPRDRDADRHHGNRCEKD